MREPGAEANHSIFTKDALEAFITEKKKDFLKTPCAQCGGSAKLAKKYKDTMIMIIKQMSDQYWCRDCGRILCDTCRYNHTCEVVDAEKEKRKNMDPKALCKQMEEAEERKIAVEAAKKDEERRAMEVLESQKSERKAKRKILATKAKHVENFIQQFARDPTGRPQRVHDELLALYPKASRISLSLYNEFEHPSSQEVGGEDWEEMKDIYARSRELTGAHIMTEEGPLDMRNPWDPPPPNLIGTTPQED